METEPIESTAATAEPNVVDTDQLSNAELRERFLRFLQLLPGRSVDVKLYGDIQVGGKFVAAESSNFEYYLVDDLKTPMGVIEHAALRMRDTMFLEIPLNEGEENEETIKEMIGKIEEEQPKSQ
ncbi:hypothetical protein niasHT_024431 [Heterodera trifolii]|uniref:Uncharacterized protein n=1 Tax=Heterodera trifolii TaxID=157864 RepID=A0ABD2JYK8_9BILA